MATSEFPIQAFILKVTESCNLNCDYCYMFNLKDKSYLRRPKIMTSSIMELSARAIIRYAERHRMDDLDIIFHGGEPLLAGKSWFYNAVKYFRESTKQIKSLNFYVQTNATLIDSSWVDLFTNLDIKVGVSLDGTRAANDMHRLDHLGRSSFERTIAGIQLLQDKDKLAGVLCVVDPSINGAEVYNYFRELDIKLIDFLLPLEYNQDQHFPIGKDTATPFADYLISVFDTWFSQDDPSVNVRIFHDLIGLMMGSRHSTDAWGGSPVRLLVIESDGSLGPVDSLRACGDGFTDLGLSVAKGDEIDLVYEHDLFQRALLGKQGLCESCLKCTFKDVCGGGYLPHRYSKTNGFDNPSVYCPDIYKMLCHITNVVHNKMHNPELAI